MQNKKLRVSSSELLGDIIQYHLNGLELGL